VEDVVNLHRNSTQWKKDTFRLFAKKARGESVTNIIDQVWRCQVRLIPEEACSCVFAFRLEDIDVHVFRCPV